jgi:ribose 5-phosphate isomerase RpiB
MRSDHVGFEPKEAVKAFLTGEKGEVLDAGTYGKEPVDYPDCAGALGRLCATTTPSAAS